MKKDARRRRPLVEGGRSLKEEARQRRTFGLKKDTGCEEGYSAKKAARRRRLLVEGGRSSKEVARGSRMLGVKKDA